MRTIEYTRQFKRDYKREARGSNRHILETVFQQLLATLVASVYAECSFVELYAGQASAAEVIAWLRERHFRLNGVYNMAYDRTGRAA